MIYDEETPPKEAGAEVVRPDSGVSGEPSDGFEDLLIPVMRGGKGVYEPPPIEQTRLRTFEQVAALPEDVKRFEKPGAYPVRLETALAARKREMIRQIQGGGGAPGGGRDT